TSNLSQTPYFPLFAVFLPSFRLPLRRSGKHSIVPGATPGETSSKTMLQRRKIITPVVAALSVFSLAGLWAAAAEQPSKVMTANADPSAKPTDTVAESYRLGPGDRVRVTVYKAKDLSGTFEVASDRTMALPLIGSIEA